MLKMQRWKIQVKFVMKNQDQNHNQKVLMLSLRSQQIGSI